VIAVDTNVLVLILADDPGQPAQVQAARRLAGGAKQVFVPTVVQSDCVMLAGCRSRDLPLYTFDKRLAKLAGAELVSTDP
jgi:predicted nucleic acid-binding protein